MADSKLVALTTASSLVATDLMYVVKPATSPYDHKVSVANLFGGIPVPVVLEDDLILGGAVQTMTSAGAISIASLVTKITSPHLQVQIQNQITTKTVMALKFIPNTIAIVPHLRSV